MKESTLLAPAGMVNSPYQVARLPEFVIDGSDIDEPSNVLDEDVIVTFGSVTAISSRVTGALPVFVMVVEIVVVPPIPDAKQVLPSLSVELIDEMRILLVVADIGVSEPNPEVSVCFTGLPLLM